MAVIIFILWVTRVANLVLRRLAVYLLCVCVFVCFYMSSRFLLLFMCKQSWLISRTLPKDLLPVVIHFEWSCTILRHGPGFLKVIYCFISAIQLGCPYLYCYNRFSYGQLWNNYCCCLIVPIDYYYLLLLLLQQILY